MSETEILMPLLGGAMIGLAAILLLALNGRVMGVSGMWSGLIRWSDGPGWRLGFFAGAIAAPVLLAAFGRPGQVQIDTPMPVFLIAGVLVGFGTAIGSGCTSGHGICGISRLSPRSVIATLVFIGAGVATVFVVRNVI
jgi:uncharacterized protein